VSGAPEYAVETPGAVPVEPMHGVREIGRLCRFQEIVDMIAHATPSVSLESVLIFLFRQVTERVNRRFRKGTAHVEPAPIQAALSRRMGGR
jgi:hypothetical protein